MIEIPKKEPLNIVPFIDIMLVLLAMVLSVSTFIAKGEIPMELPKAQSAASTNSQSHKHVVQVDAAGDLYIDGRRASQEELAAFVAELNRSERIVLRIDKNAKFDDFIRVIDALKTHQHENFSIVTEKAAP